MTNVGGNERILFRFEDIERETINHPEIKSVCFVLVMNFVKNKIENMKKGK